MLSWRWLRRLGAPLAEYGLAWGVYSGVEHDRPETFGQPVWSAISVFRKFFLFGTERLGPHLAARRVGRAVWRSLVTLLKAPAPRALTAPLITPSDAVCAMAVTPRLG